MLLALIFKLCRAKKLCRNQHRQEVKACMVTKGAENIEAESCGTSKVMVSVRRGARCEGPLFQNFPFGFYLAIANLAKLANLRHFYGIVTFLQRHLLRASLLRVRLCRNRRSWWTI